jgi:hypothetical protein
VPGAHRSSVNLPKRQHRHHEPRSGVAIQKKLDCRVGFASSQ